MATQYIDLQVGVEQTFQLDCLGTIYRFELFYDDFNLQWFMNVYNNDTDVAILKGIYLMVGVNTLKFLEYLGLGTGLGLFDTDLSNTAAIVKSDLGNRIKLYREV
jgi:hypothetical protein